MEIAALSPYFEGPGFIAGNVPSKDGAILAAPKKRTQEKHLLQRIAQSAYGGLTGINLWDTLPVDFGEVQLSTVRARLTTLKKAGKIVALSETRMELFGVANHAYVLPEYGPRQDDPQGDFWQSE